MIIEIENIKKSFKKKTVLDGVSLSAKTGEIIAIVGSNGSGKSTLFSILSGILKADGGDFLCDKESLFKNTDKRSRTVSLVPQTPPLFEELSARDNLSLFYKKDEMKKELEDGVLKLLGINEFLKKPVKHLSGGMKKRLSVGMAVAGKPKLLLLDEPSSALDVICRESIKRYLLEFRKSGAVIIATHDLAELEICDRIYLLKDGKTSLFDYDGTASSLERALCV